MSEEAKPEAPAKEGHKHPVLDAVKDFTKKAVDATILNDHPSGAPIDHTVNMDGKFAKDAFDATVMNDHPSGAPIGKFIVCNCGMTGDVYLSLTTGLVPIRHEFFGILLSKTCRSRSHPFNDSLFSLLATQTTPWERTLVRNPQGGKHPSCLHDMMTTTCRHFFRLQSEFWRHHCSLFALIAVSIYRNNREKISYFL